MSHPETASKFKGHRCYAQGEPYSTQTAETTGSLKSVREKRGIYNMSFVGALDTLAPRILKGTLKNLNIPFVEEKDKVEGLQERFVFYC